MLTPEPHELPRKPHRTTPVRDDPFSTYAIGLYDGATDTLVIVAGTLREDDRLPCWCGTADCSHETPQL